MTRRAPTSAPPTEEVKVRFGKNLARARRRAGLSQEELAFLAGLHRTEVGLIERGERTPRIDTAAKLSGALEVPVEEMLEGIAWRPPPVTSGGFDISRAAPSPRAVPMSSPSAAIPRDTTPPAPQVPFGTKFSIPQE